MAITATFKADFSSFNDAVKKAEVHLRDLESDAGKVDKALSRVADSFSGKKIIQDAQLAAKAIGDIANITKLTEQEQARLNATVTEALAKYKALGKDAPGDLQALGAELQRIRGNTEKLTPAADTAGVSFKSLFGAFSLGSIAANVVGQLAGQVTELVSKGAKLPAIEQSFERLSASVGEDSGKMLSALQKATRGMVSEFDLMQSSNKALLLGLPVTAASMGDMAAAATALGKAMGMDATKSLDDLITALGRSSPMILDNLGLSVKLGDAHQALADKLGKSVEALTEAEKKQAFYEAAMEAARKKTKELGEQTETFGDIVTQVWTDVADVITKSSAKANVEIGKMLKTPSVSPSGKDSLLVDDAAVNQFKVLSEEMDKLGKSGGKVAQEWGKVSAPLKVATMSATELKDIEDQLTESAKKSTAEMTKAAEQLSRKQEKAAADGVKAFKGYHDMLENVNISMGTLVHKHLEELGDRGQKVLKLTTDEAVRFGLAMSGNIPVVEGLGKGLGILGEKSETGLKPAVELAKQFKVNIGDLSTALSQLSQVAGGSFGAVASGFATMVSAANTAKQAIENIKAGAKAGFSLDGILGMTTGISGIVTAALTAVNAIKALWSAFDRNKGRDLVEDFAGTMGGFDELHKKLLMLGESGEALWVKLTQGVGRNNPEQAQKVIDEVSKALEQQADSQDEVTAATEEQAQATIETASQAAKALDELGPKLKENEGLWEHWGSVATAQIQAIADAVRSMPLPSTPLSGGSAAVTAPSGGDAGAQSQAGTTIILERDGAREAEFLVPFIPGVVQRYGLA